jgi:hypothetical protein
MWSTVISILSDTKKGLRNLWHPKSRFLVHLLHLINHCLRLSHFPIPWKDAKIITLPKPGKDSKFLHNLLPISLLSTTGKLFEVILYIVKRHIDEKGLLNAGQFGLRACDSTLQCVRTTFPYISAISRRPPSSPLFGLFEFPFMSFGLRNTTQTFQRFMDEVLRRLDVCFAYLDEILVFSRSLEEHERHLRSLFGRLQTYGFIINPTKCVFRASEVRFIGYKISPEGSRQLEERATHLQDFPPPKTVSQLPSFPGHSQLL